MCMAAMTRKRDFGFYRCCEQIGRIFRGNLFLFYSQGFLTDYSHCRRQVFFHHARVQQYMHNDMCT